MSAWLDDDEQRTWRLYLAMSRRLPEALERQTRTDAGSETQGCERQGSQEMSFLPFVKNVVAR